MKNKKLISVIIPVNNREEYIARAIRSLLNQNFERKLFQIIVINDASKDKTGFILDLFKDDIEIITNKKKMGLAKSINLAIKKSKTPYVIRVDSDDYVNENFLKILFLFLENNKEYDAVSCDYIKVDENENVLSTEDCFKKPIACGILFKTDQLLKLGLYDENFSLHEERDLRLRFLKKYKLLQVKLPLYRYRMHKNNITNDKVKFNKELKKLKKKYNYEK
jgi:glycosyltransferase involved in cell wall biosynthesis